MLASRPGWTIAAIICLAIATGANTAAFTLVNGVLLRSYAIDVRPDVRVFAYSACATAAAVVPCGIAPTRRKE